MTGRVTLLDEAAEQRSEPSVRSAVETPVLLARFAVQLAVVLLGLGLFVLAFRLVPDLPLALFNRPDLPAWALLVLAVVVAVAGLLPWASSRPAQRVLHHPLSTALALAAVLALFLTPALVSWLVGSGGYSRLGGVLPWSDASGYHLGAQMLLEHGQLDAFNSRRPLNAGFYATRWWITGGSFWLTMLLQGLVAGAAAFLLLRVVAARYGAAAGLVMLSVVFTFARPLLDVTLTEPLGLALGCLAAAALWHGVATRRIWLFAVGLLVFTVAMNVRGSAFFVIPMLLLWVLVATRRGWKPSWRPVAVCVGAVLVGFALNLPITALFGSGQGGYQGNFSYTLYGLANGGTGWISAQEAFAGRTFATERELTDAIFAASWDLIRERPGRFLRTLTESSLTYQQHIYGFASASSPYTKALERVYELLTVAGWAGLLIPRQHRRLGSMLLAAWIGIILSAPFIYPDGGHRVMAPIIPLYAVVPGVGAAFLLRAARRLSATPERTTAGAPAPTPRLVAGSCAVVLTVLVAGPPVAVGLHRSADATPPACPAGLRPVVLEAGPQSAHLLLLDDDTPAAGFRRVNVSRFRAPLAAFGVEIAPALVEVPPGSVVIAGYDLLADPRKPLTAAALLLVAPAGELPDEKSLVSACGRLSDVAPAADYGLMYADDLQVVDR